MRVMIAIGLILLLGCGKKEGTEPATEARGGPSIPAPAVPMVAEKPLAFDPEDGERTLRWIAEQHATIQSEIKPGNEISGREATRKVDELLAGMKGKTLAWKVKIASIHDQGVAVSPIEITADVLKNGISIDGVVYPTRRHYCIKFTSEAPVPDGYSKYSPPWPGEIGVFKHDGWAKDAASGESAILKGKIVEARGDPRYVPRTWETRDGEHHWMEPFVFKINGSLTRP